MPERRFILKFQMAPGDVAMLTSLVRDLRLTYGDRYEVDVRTNFPALWRHNPHLTPLQKGPGVEDIDLQRKAYLPALAAVQRGERIHFVRAFHRTFRELTGVPVPLLYPRPDFHLSEEEKATPLVGGRYWIVVPGGKDDTTCKFWSQARWQELVDRLRPWGLRFVQEGATKKRCIHPPLRNVLNLVGMTSVRDLMRNIYHAEGVVCGVTSMMHIAAGFEKPCVVLAGGREEPWWEEYSNDWQAFGPSCGPVRVPHRYLHTLGQMACCQKRGCWRCRVVPLRDGSARYNEKLCLMPVRTPTQILPRCMQAVEVDHVVEAVFWYYEQGFLPPPQAPSRDNWLREEPLSSVANARK